MSDITKRVNAGINTGERNQSWDTSVDTNDDDTHIIAGDIFRIEDSLGRAGRSLSITTSATGSISYRLNPVVTVYPRRNIGEFGYISESYDLVASGRDFVDTSIGPTIIEAGETITYAKGEVNVRTLQIVTMSGDFKVIVT